MDLDRLLARISAAKLFSSLGKENLHSSVVRIWSWDEWAGPEDPNTEEIGLRQQSLHDQVVLVNDEHEWQLSLRRLVNELSRLVPYHEDEDAWYGPNIAVWSAAWTFALEEVHIARKLSIPSELSAQLHWYCRGHWPCSLTAGAAGTSEYDYVVF